MNDGQMLSDMAMVFIGIWMAGIGLVWIFLPFILIAKLDKIIKALNAVESQIAIQNHEASRARREMQTHQPPFLPNG